MTFILFISQFVLHRPRVAKFSLAYAEREIRPRNSFHKSSIIKLHDKNVARTNCRELNVITPGNGLRSILLHWKQITGEKLKMDTTRGSLKGGGVEGGRESYRTRWSHSFRTGTLLSATKSPEFDAHLAVYHRQKDSQKIPAARLIREIQPTKVCQAWPRSTPSYSDHCVPTPIPLDVTLGRRQKARQCWKIMELRNRADEQEKTERPRDDFHALKTYQISWYWKLIVG